MLPSGCTESFPSTSTCHHLTSSCLTEDPSQCFQAVSVVYNHSILTKVATKKPIYVNKQSTLPSTTRKHALTNEPSAAISQCTSGTRSNTPGNPAKSSTSRILAGNQGRIWLKYKARSSSEQGSICVHASPRHPPYTC